MNPNRRPAPGNRRILLLNGPNLNLLGERDPGKYGPLSLDAVVEAAAARADSFGLVLVARQSNHEGELIDRVHEFACGDPELPDKVAGIIVNAGAYTHTSIALRDALDAAFAPAIEVHISNVHARESFRHHSYLSAVCRGQIVGFGPHVYELAVTAFALDLGLMGGPALR